MDKFINGKQSEYMINQKYWYKSNDTVRALKHNGIYINMSELIIKKENADTNI